MDNRTVIGLFVILAVTAFLRLAVKKSAKEGSPVPDIIALVGFLLMIVWAVCSYLNLL
jgi:hypothetical protein